MSCPRKGITNYLGILFLHDVVTDICFQSVRSKLDFREKAGRVLTIGEVEEAAVRCREHWTAKALKVYGQSDILNQPEVRRTPARVQSGHRRQAAADHNRW